MINRCTPVALAAALLMAGCSFIPTYERPAAPVPEAYRSGSAPQGDAASAQAAAALPWQDYFTDPRLQQLISAALVHNRDLQVAVLNIEQARAQYRITRADQFPTINGGATATRAPTGISGTNATYTNSYSVGLATSAWELDFFGRVGSLKEQALAQYLATEEGMRATQVSLVSAVANAWYTLLADEELLAISRRTLETREASISLTKLSFDAGVTSELDYRQAVSLTEAARATLAQQQRQRALDENALVLLLGQPLPADVRASLAGTRLYQVPALAPLPAGLPSDLLIQRPDIRQAEQALKGANANIGAARAAFFPRIALTAQFGTVSDELSGLFKSGSFGFSLAPSALLPIFDAGRNSANLDAAQVGRRIAVAQYEKAIQTAFREVSDALDSQATLQEQARAQNAQLEAETVRLKLSDLRYRNGVSSYLDLMDAQRSLFALEQSTVQVRLAQLQNQLLLYRALGGGSTQATPLAAAVSETTAR